MPHKDPEKRKAAQKALYERNREHRLTYSKAYRQRNRERMLIWEKDYRQRNREQLAIKNKIRREHDSEKRAAATRAWRKRNPERDAANKKAWRERNFNPERAAAYSKAWYARNRERVAAWGKAWYERNPELHREKCRRRRAKKKNSTVPLTSKEKEKLLLLERTRQELQTETGRVYHIDHIIPIAHGGLHHPLNLRILEGAENLAKNDKLLPEAITLAPEHFRLYSERVSPERAWEFVRQLAEGLGLSEDDLDAMISGKPLKGKPTLEDFFT
jgi:hypothetical protein